MNDGQQREVFYEDGNDTMCPTGCGQTENIMHFIQCTARHLQYGHIKRRGEFKKKDAKLRTAKVIYESFMRRIFIFFRCGAGAPHSTIIYFESDIYI